MCFICYSYLFFSLPSSTKHRSLRFENTLTSKQKLSLSKSVEETVNARGNHYRKKVFIKQSSSFGLEENTRQERIDLLSVQKNIIVDIPGESDSLICIVAHYDKTDTNPLKAASIFINDLLDPLISWSYTTHGAIDNATGVAIALQLAKSIAERDNKFSY
ncbi:M28 family peptidase [Flavobacteriaceae bacterium]|nr:M28 family peptidase [Flavobacteriaceae bacterium]